MAFRGIWVCLVFALLPKSLQGQLNQAYFQTLQTQRLSSSDTIEWAQIGPGMSGYCEEFWCHPTDENVMFMSPDMYNTYGSWDNGLSWQTIKDVDGTGKDMRRVQAIVFSHQDPNFGLAIDVRGALYQSTDQGHHWTPLGFDKGKHSELAVDPSNDNIWYMGAGDFWNVKANQRTQAKPGGDHVYNFSDYGHVYKSSDRGRTWTKKTNGLPADLDVGRIIVDPTNGNNLIMAANAGVFRSTNQGESWSLSGTGLPNNRPRDLSYYHDPTNNEFILYVLEQPFFYPDGQSIRSEGGVYMSNDHGASWTNITGNLAIDLTQITNYFSRDKYHNAMGFWFGMSKNQAKSQYPAFPDSILPVFNRLVVNPLDKNEIYVSHNLKHDRSFGPGDVWKTEDGGLTWKATARTGSYWTAEQNKSYWQERGNPLGMNTTYAHLQREQVERQEIFGCRFLAINRVGDAFACLEQQILRSNDHGSTWQQVDDNETEPGSQAWVGRGGSNLPGRYMLLETGIRSRYLFCSGEHGLWETASLGTYPDKKAIALRQIEGQVHEDAATSIASVAVHPHNPDIIYMLMFRQNHRCYFRRSMDGGKTWANLSRPIDHVGNDSGDMMFQYSLLIDPENPDIIYFSLISNAIAEVSVNKFPKSYTKTGVYKSTDGGQNWTRENSGFPAGASVRRLAMHPDSSEVLYAALNFGSNGGRGGLYKTNNRAQSWEQVSIPAVIKAVNYVSIDRNSHDILISCGSDEGSLAEGGVWRSKDNGHSWEKIFAMPYIWQAESSPLDSNLLTVSAALPHENRGATTFNPGAYLSYDGGLNWLKVNRNLGQPDVIVDFKPDPYIKGIYWLALKGSGWSIGYTKGMKKGWEELIGGVTHIQDQKGDARDLDQRFELYPNPSRGWVTVSWESSFKGETLMVSDAKGVQLMHRQLAPHQSSIRLQTTQWGAGTYFITLEGEGKKGVQRFIQE